MKNIMICEKLYNDVDSLYGMFKSMEYEDTIFGSEISNFYYIPQGIDERLTFYTKEDIEVQPNTGVFRKPNKMIHVEQFYQHCLWVCILALEDTELTLYEHENVKTVFDVPQDKMEEFMFDNCMDESKWTITQKLNIKKNNFVFIRPWIWHSLSEGKLVQMFLLNQKLQQEE